LSPAEVCRRYRDQGYDFLCVSDHFRAVYGFPVTDTRDFRTNRFTTILGAEVHAGANSQGEPWHILAVGLPADFAPTRDDESAPALAARCRAAGAFVVIAHPQWSGLTMADVDALAGAHGIEVFNNTCLLHADRPDGAYLMDAAASRGRLLYACATDDAHMRGVDDLFGGWVMVKAREPSPEMLLDALKAGDFYASQGPLIHDVALDGDAVRIACSPVARAIVVGSGSANKRVHGHDLTEVAVPLHGLDRPWLRVTVVDAHGRRAWTHPFPPRAVASTGQRPDHVSEDDGGGRERSGSTRLSMPTA
jgi:hypothetical protein